jgi:hypothetical protein
VFTHQQALDLLPVIKKITDESCIKVEKLLTQLESVKGHDEGLAKMLEDQINDAVSTWQCKIEKLGAEGKGLWLVDFDNGNGFYCWKYPEQSIDHLHGYSEGFQSRKKITRIAPSPISTL